MTFFFEILIGGLLSGLMYSLVALGFVLIYKPRACSTSRRARWSTLPRWRWWG